MNEILSKRSIMVSDEVRTMDLISRTEIRIIGMSAIFGLDRGPATPGM